MKLSGRRVREQQEKGSDPNGTKVRKQNVKSMGYKTRTR